MALQNKNINPKSTKGQSLLEIHSPTKQLIKIDISIFNNQYRAKEEQNHNKTETKSHLSVTALSR